MNFDLLQITCAAGLTVILGALLVGCSDAAPRAAHATPDVADEAQTASDEQSAASAERATVPASCDTFTTPEPGATMADSHDFTVSKTDAQWRQILSPQQYHVLRERGTERAFTGKYWDEKAHGTYACAACGEALFDSDTKFKSGTGWPSFYDVVEKGNVKILEDRSHGMVRKEVICANCGSHLGHVFADGPRPTGLRYCINSASLELKPRDAGDAEAE